jgi:soluble epoxide hydrolase / lipid-phosphate phosphatase
MHGPLNWYRTREVNWEDEWAHFFRFGELSEPPRLEHEVLFVLASRDGALKPELAKKMVEGGELLPSLRRREVQAGHWALWETPEEVNEHVGAWLEEVVLKGEEGLDAKAGVGSKL